MKIEVISFSQSKKQWYSEFTAEYLKKAGQFCPIQRTSLSGVRSKKKNIKKDCESSRFLEFVTSDDYVVVCDENGTSLSSQQFAKKMNTWLGSSKKRLIFAIGGSFGWSDKVLERAEFVLSLSNLTMNHLLAEMAICEQIYRGLSLLKGHPYHNE